MKRNAAEARRQLAAAKAALAGQAVQGRCGTGLPIEEMRAAVRRRPGLCLGAALMSGLAAGRFPAVRRVLGEMLLVAAQTAVKARTLPEKAAR